MAEAVKNVLVGLDESAASEAALLQALELAASRGAQVVAVHVVGGGYDPFKTIEYGVHEQLVDTTEAARRFEERVQQLVQAWQEERAAGAPKLITEVLAGPPGKALASAAGRHDADTVVVGSRNRSKLSRAVLGSVAEWLLRHAGCAVLVVRAKPDDKS